MPNRVVVKPHHELVSVRPLRKGSKPHHMGSVSLENVTITRDGLEGDLLDEFSEARELDERVLRHMVELVFEPGLGFGTVSVYDDDSNGEADTDEIVMFHPLTGKTFQAAYVCGADYFVSKR